MRYFYLLILLFLVFGCGTFAGYHDGVADNFFRDMDADTIPIEETTDTLFITHSDSIITEFRTSVDDSTDVNFDTIRVLNMPMRGCIIPPYMVDSLIIKDNTFDG